MYKLLAIKPEISQSLQVILCVNVVSWMSKWVINTLAYDGGKKMCKFYCSLKLCATSAHLTSSFSSSCQVNFFLLLHFLTIEFTISCKVIDFDVGKYMQKNIDERKEERMLTACHTWSSSIFESSFLFELSKLNR